MPDLLLEFLSEEIPARMQARAADDLKKMVTDRLVAAGLVYEGAKAFATPRRLALSVHGVPARQPDIKEEKKGPRVGAPGGRPLPAFLKAAGLKSIGEAKVQPDKKGDFYVAVIEKAGKPAHRRDRRDDARGGARLPVAEVDALGRSGAHLGAPAAFHHRHLSGRKPKSPTSSSSASTASRPATRRAATASWRPAPIKVRRFDDYVAKLEKAKVVLDPARRADIIRADAKNLAFAQGFELVEDDGLLAEVAGLVEWPVTLMGAFDKAFLAIPGEVIRATIRTNQKCFVLRDPADRQARQQIHPGRQYRGQRRRQGDRRRQRARHPRAAVRRQVLLRHRSEDRLEDRLPKFERHRVSREARHAGRAHRAHRRAGERTGAAGQGRSEEGRARRAFVQGRSADRSGRRIPRAARPDGEILRRGAGRGRSRRACLRGSLQAEGAGRPGAGRSGVDRRRAGRQDRHAGRLLGDRREADRERRTLMRCAARRWA